MGCVASVFFFAAVRVLFRTEIEDVVGVVVFANNCGGVIGVRGIGVAMVGVSGYPTEW